MSVAPGCRCLQQLVSLSPVAKVYYGNVSLCTVAGAAIGVHNYLNGTARYSFERQEKVLFEGKTAADKMSHAAAEALDLTGYTTVGAIAGAVVGFTAPVSLAVLGAPVSLAVLGALVVAGSIKLS